MKTLIRSSLALTFAISFASAAAAQEKVLPTQTWRGDVADAALQQAAPSVVGSQKALDALWATWKQPGAAPQVDFAKEFVVVATSLGGTVNVLLQKRAANINVLDFSTRDIRPGFRFLVASVSRQGVDTVNGQAIPKE